MYGLPNLNITNGPNSDPVVARLSRVSLLLAVGRHEVVSEGCTYPHLCSDLYRVQCDLSQVREGCTAPS